MMGIQKASSRNRCTLVIVLICFALIWESECASRRVRNPSSSGKQKNSLNSVISSTIERTSHNTPKIGVYERNFAGHDVRVIAETGGGLPKVEDATLPVLKVEDHIWDGKSIQLTCNASYPVKFEYIGPGMPIVKTETYRKAPDFNDPKTYTFAVSVVFSHTTEQQSGNYTCRSILDPALASHIYLFVPGERVFIGDSVTPVNETILVRASERDQWVTLPCACSIKNSQVQPFKMLASGRLQEIPLSESVTYDVASGYHLKLRGENSMKDAWGNYLWSVSGDRYEKIHLRVVPPQSNKRIVKLSFYYPNLRLKIVIRMFNPRYNSGKKFVETVKPLVVGDGKENSLTYEREGLTGMQ